MGTSDSLSLSKVPNIAELCTGHVAAHRGGLDLIGGTRGWPSRASLGWLPNGIEAMRWLHQDQALLTPEDLALTLNPGYDPHVLFSADFMESMLSHRKGAAFFPHISQGMLGAYQQLSIDITGCANMWGEYWAALLCMVRTCM